MRWPALIFFALLAGALTSVASPIIVERTAIQQIEDGPIVTLDYDFRPGETVYFTFHLAKFETVENDDKQKLELAYRIEVTDADGLPVVEPTTGKIATEMLPEDRNWTPKGRWNFVLPDHAEGGKYTITLVAQDLIGKTETRATKLFMVNNRKVERSDTLVVRSFGFYRNEESVRALDPAVYHAGESVWVKFDLTGYKLAANNQMDVQYGLTVLEPSGKVSFTQPEAAREKFQSFYPKRFVPAIFNLTLPPNVTRGVFTLVLTIRDHAGNQDLELRREFTIE
jgi:hypothetical protein